MRKVTKYFLVAFATIGSYFLLSLFFSFSSMMVAEEKGAAYLQALPDFWYIKIVCIFFIGLVIYFLTRRPLNIKDKEVGHGQHGDARFMEPDEIPDAYRVVPFGAEQEPGILVGVEGNKWIVDDSDQNVLLTAPPGAGKTSCEYIPTIKYNALVNKNTNGAGASMLIVDIKGTLYNATAAELQANGYRTPILNFRKVFESFYFNLMYKVNLSMRKYLRAQNPKDKVTYLGEAERNAKMLAENIIESARNSGSDSSKYFNDTAGGLITGVILLVAEHSPAPAKHIISVFNIINRLAAQDTASTMRGVPESKLSALLKEIEGSRVCNYTGAATSADIRTQLNILSSALQNLLRFIDAELEQMLCRQSPELYADEFAAQPTAIFIISPDENPTRHFMVSLFIRSFINDLIEIASDRPDETIGRLFFLLFDEFGNYPALQHVVSLFSAIRSRGGRVLCALQSLRQLNLSYDENVAEIIIDSCQIVMSTFVSPLAEKMASLISKMLGNQTILSGSSSTTAGKVTTSVQMIGRALLSPSQLVTIPWGTYIVQKGGHLPAKFNLKHYKMYLQLETRLQTPPPTGDYSTVVLLSPSYLEHALKGQIQPLKRGLFD